MAYLLLSLAAVFWGGNYVAGNILVGYINPYALSVLRWGFTTLFIFGVYRRVIFTQWGMLCENLKMNFVFSLLGQVCFPLTLYIGLQHTSSLNASIYISSTPCLVLLINALFFKEKISFRNIIGVIVSTFGVLYLAFSNSVSGELKSFGMGDIFTILSALSWAFYCALLRFKDKRVSNTAFVGFNSLIGTIILIVIYIVYSVFSSHVVVFIQKPSLLPVLGVIYLVVFPSWLSYVFWSKGVQLIGTTRSEIFTHVIPVSGGILSIALLNEKFHTYHSISLLFIIIGIIFCSGNMKFNFRNSTQD
ncbi:DMT family transporter [Salmonella enterica subsp. enterica]|nr:DMT family transporter [Salmonella enterica subsp. enterica serovar Virchow]